MHNSRQSLLKQAEKIVESYSRKRVPKSSVKVFTLFLSVIIISALITGFFLLK